MMEDDEGNRMGKLLPNLKIIVGTDSDSLTEEGEISDTIVYPKDEIEKSDVQVVRTWMTTLKNPKVYENKDGAFITGLDLSSETLVRKLQERAERFGLKRKEETITQKEIDALYKSLGIEPENLITCKLKNIRLEALHMRGVQEMNTNEIFAYFKEYGPSTVEWINDFSCNVVWVDSATTARAIIGMSHPFVIKKKSIAKQGITESMAKDHESKNSDVEDYIELTDPKKDDSEDKKDFDEAAVNAMEIDLPSDSEKPENSDTKMASSEELSEVDVPVPPGHWRLGIPHPKSKAILFRFATKDDKKLPGAEKRSQYYQKYGNPNYGGLKGIISPSKKRKIQAARNRQVVEKLTEDSTSLLEIKSGETSKRTILKASRSKMPRMRMYADDEDVKKKKAPFLRHESGRQSVHSRLGTKYTKDDLVKLGNRFSSESEEEDDNISINCTVPSRLNIWEDIARSMGEEDRQITRNNPPSFKPVEKRKFRNYRAREDKSYARDRSSETTRSSRPWKVPRKEYYSRDRSSATTRDSRPWKFSRDESSEYYSRNRSSETTRDSRPWRSSRDESSEYYSRDRSSESTRASRPWKFSRDDESSEYSRDRSSGTTRGSRPWRVSRDETSEDSDTSSDWPKHQSPLNRPDWPKHQGSLNRPNWPKHQSPLNRPEPVSDWPKHQSPLNRPEEDVGTTIKQIKKDDVYKHRSPMYLDD